MFDKLEDLLIRYEELMSELSEPDVANNPERFRKLMKEQSDILPIVEAYKEYKQCKHSFCTECKEYYCRQHEYVVYIVFVVPVVIRQYKYQSHTASG